MILCDIKKYRKTLSIFLCDTGDTDHRFDTALKVYLVYCFIWFLLWLRIVGGVSPSNIYVMQWKPVFNDSTVQSQTAVTAYLKSKQLLLFDFAKQQ